jgi:uncharacterized protein (DUF1501 family)
MQRRNFLKTASWAALAQLADVSPLRSMAAFAQNSTASDYKAIVCLFMRGGNDSNNMLVPLASSQYNAYSQARGSSAVAQGELQALANSNYGLNPAFSNLKQAYASGNAAMIANVGPLVQPTTVAQYRATSVQIPRLLMAHDDQQEAWESGAYEPGVGPSWAGLTSDLLSPNYNSPGLPMVTLVGEATNFGRGQNSAPFTASPGAQQANFWCSDGGIMCYPRDAAAQQLLTFSNGVNLLQADQQIYQQAYKYNKFYNGVLADAKGFRTNFPSRNPLSGALYTVATMMQLRNEIGAKRQIFLIDANGFDTHGGQDAIQPALYGMIDQAVGTFVQVMQEIGLYNNVTLFTASDFSRTLSMNSANGSDHAWGGHHFVVGGAVKGGRVIGSLPNLQLGGPDDIDGSGRFVPTTALSQYMATLASWFGVPNSALGTMFPGLTNFPTTNLGFV